MFVVFLAVDIRFYLHWVGIGSLVAVTPVCQQVT